MSLSIDRFGEFFGALYQDKQGKPIDPFPWQARLAKQVFDVGWPECIDLPTASGKTTAIDVAVFVLACQAGLDTNQRTVGRRIFFTVNRRVIVDEAFDRANELADRLLKEESNDAGILGEVARALRSLNGESDPAKAPPLDRVQLRGGVYRDRAWARSITQPIVVCTTADQLGSRLLFRGYGVSTSSAPIHAALCGCDSLVLLDEAHVTRAFSQTMQLLSRYQEQHGTAPKMRFVQMTATPAGEVKNRFGLDEADRLQPILRRRQEASKPVALVKLEKKKPITGAIVSRAFDAVSALRKAVGIIVNRVQTAREIEQSIREEIDRRTKKDGTFDAEVHLVIGRMRPIDRDDLQKALRKLVGPERADVFPADAKPVFVVATQCLEVGADYDFDVMITECASIDAMRQRLGRLNRKGRSIEVVAAIVTNEESLKGDDPIYGDAIKNTWNWLTESDRSSTDFGIAAFKKLWDDLDEAKRQTMLAPAPDAAVLLPAHLDALCQTSPCPKPSPDVSYFIHGPQRDNAEVNICWRADLTGDETQWRNTVRLLPPTSTECMTVPLRELRRWMIAATSKDDRDADIPVQAEPDEENADIKADTGRHQFVVWRGTKEVVVVHHSSELRPNDTIVMPVECRNWNVFGHIPKPTPVDYQRHEDESVDDHVKRRLQLDRSVDVAERATVESKLRVVVRIHPAFERNNSLRGLSDPDLRKALVDRDIIPGAWDDKPVARIERHLYRESDDDNPDSSHDEVICFKRLRDPSSRLVLPTPDEDDGEDDLSEGNRFVSLEAHTQHVVDRLAAALDKLHLNDLESTVRASAPLHDIGKSDIRFQAMLTGITPYEAMMLPKLLGKGDSVRRTQAERNAIFEQALYPRGFRHEMLSVEVIAHLKLEANLKSRELLLHLIAAHHGYGRPFAPICFDETTDDELRSLRINGNDIAGGERKTWTPSHRLDSGVADRFWKLTREHGWWGLAWLESILRLADQQASAGEQEQKGLHDE